MSLLANGTYLNNKKHHISIDIVSNDQSIGAIKFNYKTHFKYIGDLEFEGKGRFDYIKKNGAWQTNFAISFDAWYRPADYSYNFRDVWNGVHNPDGTLKMIGVRFYQDPDGVEVISGLGEQIFHLQ